MENVLLTLLINMFMIQLPILLHPMLIIVLVFGVDQLDKIALLLLQTLPIVTLMVNNITKVDLQ